MKTKKCMLMWFLTMLLLVMIQSPIQAATYNEVPIRNQAGYDFSLLMSDTRNGWNGLQIGEYCFVEIGQRMTPYYSGFAYTNINYYISSDSAISIYEKMEQLPTVTINNRPIYRTMLLQRPTDLHMAPYANAEWCVERVNPINYEVYVGPGYGETEGHMITEVVPNYKVYPSINYYGVNYDLDAGSWKDSTDWIQDDNCIWKSTEEQYTEDGSLYEDKIWFAYEGFEVVLPEMEDVTKDGYELRGWKATTGSAIEAAPGSKYGILASNAESREEWGQKNIDIKALWEPKTIGAQEVNHITPLGVTLTVDYEAYYDLTDKGFMYKESSAEDWIDVKAVEQDGKLIATVTGLKSDTAYDVKGYLENQTGKIENDVISFETYRQQSVEDVTVDNITQEGASFSAYYICDDSSLTAVFKYKKATDGEWMEVAATSDSDLEKLTAMVNNFEANTQYEVKVTLNTDFEETQSQGITSFTTLKKSSGNSGSTTTATTPTTNTTVKTNTGSSSSSVTSTTTAEAKSDSKGKASATVTESQVEEAVNKVVEEAVKQGKGVATKLEIKLKVPNDVRTVEVSIPKSAITAVADSKTDALTISTPISTITFDKETIAIISKQVTADVKISASMVDTATLSDTAKVLVGDRPVFTFSVTSKDKTISLLGGSATVSVPYIPKATEDTNVVIIYYINAEDKVEIVKDCVYDKETGMITFKTNHFSKFAVGYNKVSFNDVAETAWYSDAVSFVAARGIAAGTGNNNFSPEDKLTRGQFLVMIMKTYGIESDSDLNDNFADAGNTYYTAYLAEAKKLGITSGIGNNMFAPDREISRQEMCLLLYNTLKQMGKLPSLETGNTLRAYSDSNQIENWAKDAMNLFIGTKTIKGNGGKLNPAATSNRAQMAQVIYNLMNK